MRNKHRRQQLEGKLGFHPVEVVDRLRFEREYP